MVRASHYSRGERVAKAGLGRIRDAGVSSRLSELDAALGRQLLIGARGADYLTSSSHKSNVIIAALIIFIRVRMHLVPFDAILVIPPHFPSSIYVVASASPSSSTHVDSMQRQSLQLLYRTTALACR